MAMTWAELKAELVDLGFEEDEITSENEYGRLIRNAVNRALDLIYHTVERRIIDYYKVEQSFGYEDDDGSWIISKPKHVASDTSDEQKINVADNVRPLVSLLAAHWVWLDDDITKATMYWNEYDQLKNEILAECMRPRKAVIEGGIRW